MNDNANGDGQNNDQDGLEENEQSRRGLDRRIIMMMRKTDRAGVSADEAEPPKFDSRGRQ